MGLFSPLVPFVDVELKMAGMFTARKKIQKENGAEPDELEDAVAQAMFDLEANAHDLKVDLHDLFFLSAKEYDVAGGKKAITITVPYRLLKAYHKNQVQQRLVRELEKKFSGKHVVIVAARKIQQKTIRKAKGSAQRRPRSRTLTAVHDAILEDLVYPTEIVGKRTRVRLDGTKQTRVYLDPKDQTNTQDKLESFVAVYKKLTGKDAVFDFPVTQAE